VRAAVRQALKNVFRASGARSSIASVDLYRPMDGVRELRSRVRQDGFKGLRVLPWVWGLPPDDRRYYPLFAECCELVLQADTCLKARKVDRMDRYGGTPRL
jgi:predicted TIM-barrel fold metal-dependent hydrolase